MQMSYSPLGRAIMGGMLTSTFLTLIIVPLFYTLFDDLRVRFFAQIRTIFSRTSAEKAVAESNAS
jgi:HAE1 family hydrophobic/amphiphilic exporter-1